MSSSVIRLLIGDKNKVEENRQIKYPPKNADEYKYCDNKIKTYRYELWNFLFINLYFQFRKLANAYYLCLIIVTFIAGPLSPISPFVTMVPLSFVILTTLVKQGYEDYQRHKSDNVVNGKKILIYENGVFVEKTWADIKVGNIVKVIKDNEFPSDLMLLASDNDEGSCQITTANLDGETNIKKKFSLKETAHMSTEKNLKSLNCFIEYEQPCFNLYKFNGKCHFSTDSSRSSSIMLTGWNKDIESLSIDNYLLRGSKLKNTSFIIGLVLYTGEDTKIALNLRSKRTKISVVDNKMNKLIILMMIVLIVMITISMLLKYTKKSIVTLWYLSNINEKSASRIFIDIITFLSAYNYIIPISLYVTLEVEKFLNSLYIGYDLDMFDEETKTYAKANTSDIIEELGQVEYIFSDKTGTLTENNMVFKKCYINNSYYEECDDILTESSTGMNCVISQKAEITEFLKALALCNTVSVDKALNGEIEYLASSTDEKALVIAAQKAGVSLMENNGDTATLSVHGFYETYEILNVLYFDSERKRMSVILKSKNNEILFYCKGADTTVLKNCFDGNIKGAAKACSLYSVDGLRTLAFAYKTLTQKEYDLIKQQLNQADVSIINKENNTKIVYNEVEKNLCVMGVTAVEDKLQVNVPRTIRNLKNAGIKIWVLTGDKQETAVNISLVCGHITEGMHVFYLTTQHHNVSDLFGEVLNEYIDQIKKAPRHKNFALVLDGHTMVEVMSLYKEKLLFISTRCSAVLCCRMSPIQKAEIVSMIRKSKKNPITLAIGDGANDCSMIQEAHIGVGIIGKEGNQAARTSDFCFAKFYFLQQLLFVHGYLFYTRISYTVVYFLYKNLQFIIPVFIYVLYSGYSAVTCYDDPMLVCYNMVFTALPIVIYGVSEKKYSKFKLYTNPMLYKSIRNNSYMSVKELLTFAFFSIYQGIFIYYFIYLSYNDGAINDSEMKFGIYEFYLFMGHMVVFSSIGQCLVDTIEWNVMTVVCALLSILAFPIIYSPVSLIYMINPSNSYLNSYFGNYFVLFTVYSIPQFWILMIFTLPFILLPSIIRQIHVAANVPRYNSLI